MSLFYYLCDIRQEDMGPGHEDTLYYKEDTGRFHVIAILSSLQIVAIVFRYLDSHLKLDFWQLLFEF